MKRKIENIKKMPIRKLTEQLKNYGIVFIRNKKIWTKKDEKEVKELYTKLFPNEKYEIEEV